MDKSQPSIQSVEDQPAEVSGRQISTIAFPAYGLTDSIAVAHAVHNKGGGYASRDQLAAFLEYKSTQNGAFLALVGAAKTFGLLLEEQKQLKLTPLANKLLMPESPEEKKAGLIEAFFTAPLFKEIYDEYRGRDLPEGLGLKNALRNRFGVVPGRIDVAFRTLFESAETAGFFETRGNKRQLVVPVVRSPQKVSDHQKNNGEHEDDSIGGGGGGGELPPPPPPSRSKDDLWNDYIGTLIGALRENSKEGQMDKDLMERIERLLDVRKEA